MRTAGARASGIASVRRPARCATRTTARWRATSTTAIAPTSRSCASSGIDAFRFSIAWPRVLPDGRGKVNAKGLDFYDALVDELLGNGIAPYVTLFHWDTPQVLEDAGGWPEREIVDAFSEYVEAVAERLGDRVSHWITHNEPWVVSWVGHGWGHHAPGRTSDADALATAHHLLLSHGRAVEILRAALTRLGGRHHAEPRQPVCGERLAG